MISSPSLYDIITIITHHPITQTIWWNYNAGLYVRTSSGILHTKCTCSHIKPASAVVCLEWSSTTWSCMHEYARADAYIRRTSSLIQRYTKQSHTSGGSSMYIFPAPFPTPVPENGHRAHLVRRLYAHVYLT